MRFEAKTFVRVVPRSHFSPDADKKRYRDSRTMRSPTDLVSTPRGDDDCFLGASSLVRTWFHFATREISLKSMIRTRFPLHRGVYSIHKHVFPSFNLIQDIRCRKQQLARLILHQAGAIVFEIVSHLISYSYVSLDNWYLLIYKTYERVNYIYIQINEFYNANTRCGPNNMYADMKCLIVTK